MKRNHTFWHVIVGILIMIAGYAIGNISMMASEQLGCSAFVKISALSVPLLGGMVGMCMILTGTLFGLND